MILKLSRYMKPHGVGKVDILGNSARIEDVPMNALGVVDGDWVNWLGDEPHVVARALRKLADAIDEIQPK